MFEFIIYLELIFGFFLLMFGGDFLVRGALDFGTKRGISPLIVGVTVVAMGTSAPELVISIMSTLSGHPQIALGNVIVMVSADASESDDLELGEVARELGGRESF